MFSVVILSPASAAQIEALLTALVPAAMEGLVRDVIVADPGAGMTDFLEDAGATTVKGGVEAAAKAARSGRMLVLPPEMRLPADWRAQIAKSGIVKGKRVGWFRRPVGRVVDR